MPTGVKPGDEFNAVATLKLEDDGASFCLSDVEGYPVSLAASDKESSKEDKAEAPQGYVDAVEAGLSNNAQQQPAQG